MAGLKEQLSTKGSKCNLQFSTKEREYYERECGFTDEELRVFQLRTRGYSVTRIATLLTEEYGYYYTQGKVEARIRTVKNKILAII